MFAVDVHKRAIHVLIVPGGESNTKTPMFAHSAMRPLLDKLAHAERQIAAFKFTAGVIIYLHAMHVEMFGCCKQSLCWWRRFSGCRWQSLCWWRS